jgi:hypothetical protein
MQRCSSWPQESHPRPARASCSSRNLVPLKFRGPRRGSAAQLSSEVDNCGPAPPGDSALKTPAAAPKRHCYVTVTGVSWSSTCPGSSMQNQNPGRNIRCHHPCLANPERSAPTALIDQFLLEKRPPTPCVVLNLNIVRVRHEALR